MVNIFIVENWSQIVHIEDHWCSIIQNCKKCPDTNAWQTLICYCAVTVECSNSCLLFVGWSLSIRFQCRKRSKRKSCWGERKTGWRLETPAEAKPTAAWWPRSISAKPVWADTKTNTTDCHRSNVCSCALSLLSSSSPTPLPPPSLSLPSSFLLTYSGSSCL